MKKHFLKKHEENWLRIPYEENADAFLSEKKEVFFR